MRVISSVSFEFDLKPVLTVREEFETEGFASACKTALFRAEKQHPKARPRSVVVCVEQMLSPKVVTA